MVEDNTGQAVPDSRRCSVCQCLTIGTHYGAIVCGSCASFFRRTIGSGKSYQCTCRMLYRNKKKGCRHCRFKNCLKAGMDAQGVQVIKPFPQPEDTLLSQLLACRNHVYVSKGLFLREMDAQRADNPRWRSPDLGRGRSYEYFSRVEHRGLTQYWTDFLRRFAHFKDGATPTLLTKHFLIIWLKLEQILATVSHGNVKNEIYMCDYQTTMPVTYDERETFVDDAALKQFVNQVLRELHDHYKSTYSEYRERPGVIVYIVGEFHRVVSLNKQFCMQLSLYTRSEQGLNLPAQKESISTLHELRHSVKM